MFSFYPLLTYPETLNCFRSFSIPLPAVYHQDFEKWWLYLHAKYDLFCLGIAKVKLKIMQVGHAAECGVQGGSFLL